MKIKCPDCSVTVSVDEFPNSPAQQICDECGACFELEPHMVFEENAMDEEIAVALGE